MKRCTVSVECKGGANGVWLRNESKDKDPFERKYIDYRNSSSSGKSGIIAYWFVHDGEYTLKTRTKRWRVTVLNGEAIYEKSNRR